MGNTLSPHVIERYMERIVTAIERGAAAQERTAEATERLAELAKADPLRMIDRMLEAAEEPATVTLEERIEAETAKDGPASGDLSQIEIRNPQPRPQPIADDDDDWELPADDWRRR